MRAALVPHDVVKEKSSFVSHVNAWRFLLRDNIWELPGVQDVTEHLKRTEGAL